MILAAAAHAEAPKDNPPPRDLVKAWQSKSWGTLPNDGGLRDQRIGEVERMTKLLNTYNAYSAFLQHSGKWQQFKKQNPEQWRIVMEIDEMRKAADG